MPLRGVCQCEEYANMRSVPAFGVCQCEEYPNVRSMPQ
jgi:hypothetical protein